MNSNDLGSPLEVFDQFDDELWVELIQKSPKILDNICLILSVDIQLVKEEFTPKSYITN